MAVLFRTKSRQWGKNQFPPERRRRDFFLSPVKKGKKELDYQGASTGKAQKKQVPFEGGREGKTFL